MLADTCKRLLRQTFNAAGMEVSRLSKAPRQTLLGLRNAGIRTVLDIGANSGQFARAALLILPQARFYCFEPLPEPFAKLEQWAAQQTPGSVTAFNLALGERSGTAPMFEHTDHSTSSSLLASTVLSEKLFPQTRCRVLTNVPVARLDDFVIEAALTLAPEMLIKMDVQGYEGRVIEGGRATLSHAKACVLEVSFDPLYENQSTFKDIWGMLDTLGYRFAGNLEQWYAADGHVIFADAVFVK
jgi:FkbM family methyltransferase